MLKADFDDHGGNDYDDHGGDYANNHDNEGETFFSHMLCHHQAVLSHKNPTYITKYFFFALDG